MDVSPETFAWFLRNHMANVKTTVGQGTHINGLPVGYVLVEKDNE